MEQLKEDRKWREECMTLSYEEAARIGSREEGRAEGSDARARSIAENLLTMNMSSKDISRATGLSVQEVNQLRHA